MNKIEPIDWDAIISPLNYFTIQEATKEIMKAAIDKVNEIVDDYNENIKYPMVTIRPERKE